MKGVKLLLASVLWMAMASTVLAGEDFKLIIRDHKFEPTELLLPAGQKVKVRIENRDASPEEFESYTLNREKLIPGNGKATVFLGPLKPGRYGFFGEFHKDTALGTVVVKE